VIKKLLAAASIFIALSGHSQAFDFNNNCRIAYNDIIALKLDLGDSILKAEEHKKTRNLIIPYLQNYIDFLTVYTTDSRTVYNDLKKNKDYRLELLIAGDQNSPYFLFTQAEVNLQWAALHIKFGEYLNAVTSIRRAFKLLEENRKYFPDFKANQKSLGVLYALLGSVPDKYKWGVNMLGMEGNIDKGMNYLLDLIDYGHKNDFIYQEETISYYAFLIITLQGNGEKAWQVLMDNGFPQKDNLMNVYVCAHVGVYGKHNDEALKILNERSKSDLLSGFPYLDYLSGLARLAKLDTDAASYFKKFIAEYKGENHIKSAYQKIAWGYLLQGDTVNYLHFIEKVGHYGEAVLDADKQAKKEEESKTIPNPALLRPRVLCDGGYYERAEESMNKLSAAKFVTPDEQTEYLYRLGRIYDEWNKPDSALIYYTLTIDKGRNLPRYFAANAALESAKIFEAKGDKEKAKASYNLCLSFPNHEYKDGIDQKAKAGLNRLK
jgi:hypothetical protein